MNNTLNNLALLSFKRKARKLGKNIEVRNLMDQGFNAEHLVRTGETLILWGEDNGFHSIFAEKDTEVLYLAIFPDKYNFDEVYHVGILNFEKNRLYLYRCYLQIHSNGKKFAYGLQFEISEYFKDEEFHRQDEVDTALRNAGKESYIVH